MRRSQQRGGDGDGVGYVRSSYELVMVMVYGNLTFGQICSLSGITAKFLFLWFRVKKILLVVVVTAVEGGDCVVKGGRGKVVKEMV